jgi:DNA-damage-inducible protein J
MADTTMLHVRMDEKLKTEGTAALESIGLTAADAVRILFKRIVAEQAFPLELKVPNAETRAAMEEAREIARRGKSRFKSADEMFASLEKPFKE